MKGDPTPLQAQKMADALHRTLLRAQGDRYVKHYRWESDAIERLFHLLRSYGADDPR